MPEIWKIAAVLIVLLISLAAASSFTTGPALIAPVIESKPVEPFPRLVRKETPPPSLTAEAVLVKRLKSGQVLYEKNAEERLPIASLTKLMTALLVAELDQPLAEIEFTAEAKRAGNADDNRSPIPAGDRLRAEDVLKLVLMASYNDAAYAAASHAVSLGESGTPALSFAERTESFVRSMNERAASLTLAATRFSNPAGRDDPGNYSTARDIAALAEFMSQHRPELWGVSRIQETFVFGASGRRYGVVNTNPLLQEYPAIYGSKTGYDDHAKGALLMLYQMAPGELVAMVLLRSADRFADGRTLIEWLESSFLLEPM